MDALDDGQRRALSQLRELTEGTDEEVAIGVLSSVEWDVQVRPCATSHFLPMLYSPFQDREPQS